MRRHPSNQAARALSGFTLLEIMVVLVLIGVLAALAVGGIDLMKAKASFASSTGDMTSALREVEADALSGTRYSAFVIDTAGKRWWALDNVENGFSLATFDPADPTNSADPNPRVLVESGTLPSTISFAGYGAALPSPFAKVPTTTAAGAALAGCSFCSTTAVGSSPAGSGYVLFAPGVPASFSYEPDPKPIGEQFTVSGQIQKDGTTYSTRTVAVVIVPRTGLIETLEK